VKAWILQVKASKKPFPLKGWTRFPTGIGYHHSTETVRIYTSGASVPREVVQLITDLLQSLAALSQSQWLQSHEGLST